MNSTGRTLQATLPRDGAYDQAETSNYSRVHLLAHTSEGRGLPAFVIPVAHFMIGSQKQAS